MKTILITGITGNLGYYLTKKIIENGLPFNIIGIKRKTSDIQKFKSYIKNKSVHLIDIDSPDWEKQLDEFDINTVLHLATHYGKNNDSFINMIDSNLFFPLKIFQYAVQRNIKWFINAGTSLDKKTNHYSLSKHQFLEWIHFFQKNIKIIHLEIETIFGLWDKGFISSIINQLKNNVPSINLTNGLQKRDFIYIEDLARAIVIILNHLENFQDSFTKFDIGSGQNYTIREIVFMIKNILKNNHTQLNWGALPLRENELMNSQPHLDEIYSLGWRPLFKFESSIKLMIELINN